MAHGRAVGAEAESGDGPSRSSGGWKRVFALFLVTLALSVVQPSVLVGIPLLLLVAALPVRRTGAYVAAAVAAFLAMGGGAREGLWYAERGWAILLGGWFVALTLRWPTTRFTTRGLGAVSGAAAGAALVLSGTPGGWSALDWRVGERMRGGIATALEAVRAVQGESEAFSPALVAAVYRTAEVQAQVFPAMLGLASLAALGVAWWIYVRLGFGSDRGLGPLGEFRFNDHLVWLFIGGLVLLVAGGEGAPGRAGSNAVVFMGALYALRGAAVVVFLGGGVTALGAMLLALGLLFVAPVILAGALVIGLGDTWLDIRRRIREAAA